ncbi:tectonin beta-propeller repeat-containing protein 2 [Hydra vulgaris]|uniref:Tectonin beta-propeller repeat-containing protein 2 n=1 Tax=Hydra vulgaris TaxID=6087 RepID=A0ABM4CGI9_HYDVU
MVENKELVLGQDVVLREKVPLKELLDLLPHKAQLGFTGLKDKWSKNKSLKNIINRSNDALKVQYTCLDVSNKSIVIGCNMGIVFLYTREEKKLSRLFCESKQIPIVSIKLLEEKSFIATGQFNGSVTIFKFEDDINGQVKTSLKCTVESHHTTPVTSLQWTIDGTKLFTSDSDGNVAITVINMDESISHTVFICKEDSPVTQLSFCHTALLISTLRRTLVWPFNTKKIVQVGLQERKLIGNFGACFFPPYSTVPPDDLCIYAARPGLRLWCASVDGKVCSTMIFKDSIYKGEPHISTIDLPSHPDSLIQNEQKQFGKMLVFSERFLVSWQSSCLWVIDPTTGCVIGCHSNLGSIVDVALTGNELYVLSKGETNFLRQIIFETVASVPLMITDVLDFNDPFKKVDRSSSINHFEDQDKLEKILDEVAVKVETIVKVAINDVKYKVKELKEQITSREESEDDPASDSDKLLSNIKNLSIRTNTVLRSMREEKSSSEKSNESDSNSTEIERPFEPLESSCEDEKNQNDKKKLFEHLSQKEFPSDIVYEGTSKGTTPKQTKKSKKCKTLIKNVSQCSKELLKNPSQPNDELKISNGSLPVENSFQRTSSFEADNSSFINDQNVCMISNNIKDASNHENELSIENIVITQERSYKTEVTQNEGDIKYILSSSHTPTEKFRHDIIDNSSSPEFYFIDSQKDLDNLVNVKRSLNDFSYTIESQPSPDSLLNNVILYTLEKQLQPNEVNYKVNADDYIETDVFCKNSSEVSSKKDSACETNLFENSNDINIDTSLHNKINNENSLKAKCSYEKLIGEKSLNVECYNNEVTTQNSLKTEFIDKKLITEKSLTIECNDKKMISKASLKTECSDEKIITEKSLKTIEPLDDKNVDDTNKNNLKSESDLLLKDSRQFDFFKDKFNVSDYNTRLNNIAHRRQGSNVSTHSIGHSERCREVRGEAVELSFNPQLSLFNEDIDLQSNLQIVNYEEQFMTRENSRDNCKLYPVSPFPAPQMQSNYYQRSTSFSETSLPGFDDRLEEEEQLFDAIGEYDKIDVNADLIESIESVTDIEDNLDLSNLDLSSEELKAGGIPIKKKRRIKNKSSFPNSPCGSDMEGRPLHSPKALSEVVNERLRYLADSWAEVEGPACGQLQGVACSATLLWSVDQHDHVFYTPSKVRSGMHEYTWKKLDGRAVQIACNQHGSVVWCVDRQRVAYYRTSVRENNPQGNSWEPFEKNIHCIAVDEDCVWAIKTNGDVFVRTGVTSWKPSGSGWITVKVASDLVQITSLNGLVWALDIYNHVQIFKGELENACLQDDNQHSDWCELPGISATHVMLGAKNVCWIIDCDHGVWFNEDITKENPLGGTWYQLSLGDHQSAEISLFSSTLSYFRKGNEPKMIIANDIAGVIILGKQGTLHIAHGHLLGTRWEPAIPSHMSESSCWTCVTAGGADMNRGFIWAMQPNGLLFCYKPNGQSYNVHPPAKVVLKYCSAGPRSLWALTAGPDVYVRIGISDVCAQGLKWLKVNMIGLENKRLNSICCGNFVVWSVDFEGNVWFQISRSEDRSINGFSPVWISVEGCPLDGSKFVNIVVGPDDRIVWACDDMNNVYTRKDISENFWIGTSWELVSESSCKDLAISKNHVWGLCPNGDVLCRFGVSHSNVMGDYWKKVPGNFEQISVSANDELWGIDRQGHLYQRQTMLFYGSSLSCRAPSYNDIFSDHNDWELI